MVTRNREWMKRPVGVCLGKRKRYAKKIQETLTSQNKKLIGKVCLERQMKNQEKVSGFEVKERLSIQGMVHKDRKQYN